MTLRAWALTFFVGQAVATFAFAEETCPACKLTEPEETRLESEINRFYKTGQSAKELRESMESKTPKFRVRTGKAVTLNRLLKLSAKEEKALRAEGLLKDPLLERAQAKATPEYRKYWCKNFLQKKFPGVRCEKPSNPFIRPGLEAAIESNDRVESLASSWIPANQIVKKLASLPVAGQSKVVPWSDDYWRYQWGGAGYRYADGKQPANYKEAMEVFSQPEDFLGLVANLGKLQDLAGNWSPAEKYDLAVGDETFSLTNAQRSLGEEIVGVGEDVPEWMGICHGWAPAAFMVPRPMKPVTVIGARGLKIKFNPHDTRALADLMWANGRSQNYYAGKRCSVENPERSPNGRIQSQDCFDTNPATLHLALANMVGLKQNSLIIDATFDQEVWNQPIHSYSFSYFNPLKPDQTSRNWEKAAVAYDAVFKKADRFQTPLTRGERNGNHFNDAGIKKIVGVATTLVYMGEIDPVAGEKPVEDDLVRMTLTYDLEIGANGEPLGGEWHNNDHPDFFWMPASNGNAFLPVDDKALNYSGSLKNAAANVAELARKTSKDSYPLCQVVQHLIQGSALERATYECGSRRR